MNTHSSFTSWPLIAGMVPGGFAIGVAYFAALRHMVTRLTSARPWPATAALTVARIAVTVTLFWWLAHWGAAPLLGAFAGFLLARVVAVHIVHSSSSVCTLPQNRRARPPAASGLVRTQGPE